MPSNSEIILYRRVLVETVTYMRELISFIVNHNVNDGVLVLVVTFAGVEEAVDREGCTPDIEGCPSRCVKTLGFESNRSSYPILYDLLLRVDRWMES